jgi:hypothetical protein
VDAAVLREDALGAKNMIEINAGYILFLPLKNRDKLLL